MASGRSKKKTAAFGLSTPVVLLGAAVLVMIGVAGGLALDVYMHPAPPPVRHVAATPSRPPPKPIIRLQAEEGAATSPSVLSNLPAPPVAAAPQTAEPPEVKPAPRRGPAPMLAFAVPSAAPPALPGLAIVIDDTGLDHGRALEAIALPGPVTISLMTYAPDLAALAKQARDAGHEVLAHVPMEPRDPKEKPGPQALTVAMNEAEIRAALAADLDGWRGYVGINNHMGSRFTADRARMAVVMDELKNRGLLWLDSKTTADSAGPAAARTVGVPEVERDVFLDNTQTIAAVGEEMEHAIGAAKAHGTAIAIGHPHDATIAALRVLLPHLEERGVALVPITEVLKRREMRRPS